VSGCVGPGAPDDMFLSGPVARHHPVDGSRKALGRGPPWGETGGAGADPCHHAGMCGRYVVAYDPQTLVSGFGLSHAPDFPRRFNVAPQSQVPVVHDTLQGERVATLMQWGLVPHWAQDARAGPRLNNARSESAADKPSFRRALRRRRCLLPASGFYEWQPAPAGAPPPARKQPWYVSPAAQAPGPGLLAMAGLFEAWRPAEDAQWLLTCCVLTTAPNGLMSPIHDRMPVLLAPADWARWLDRSIQEPGAVTDLLRPCPDDWLQAWPVSRAVSTGRAEGPALVQPLDAGLSDRTG